MNLYWRNTRISGPEVRSLHQDWQLTSTPANALAQPSELRSQDPALVWRAAVVPGTVAQNLQAAALLPFESINSNYDDYDWWYRCYFVVPESELKVSHSLRFDGLATLAEVWLNDIPLLNPGNMFRPFESDVGGLLRVENELVICFRSLTAALNMRRPRPHWKTSLVNHQQLRWFRTTLLGRIPGWTPPVPPIGPWQEISLERRSLFEVPSLDFQCQARGGVGYVKLSLILGLAQPVREVEVSAGYLQLDHKRYPLALAIDEDDDLIILSGDIEIPDVPLWWPHTHGQPQLLPCHIEANFNNEIITIDCGHIGFKEVVMQRDGGEAHLEINGVPVFCRGACWTVNDFVSLRGDVTQLRQSLELARDAGVNMLRVGGTMTYESEDFYRLCDELGILVWQDFMFANMDYPVTDQFFRIDIEAEVTFQLKRLRAHPCITVYCGNSEVQQQAAMLGMSARQWYNAFFDEELPRQCAQWHPGIPYFPSTPCEGIMPFQVATGLSHYYGVGAYRRPFSDLKTAAVKFTPECLGFSNVPDEPTIDLILDGTVLPPHHPAWKARVPRDSGAGWDFEDIRDHYLHLLFDVDPIALRSQDPARYLALSRATSGEVMRHAFAEWRQPRSRCGGALVWFWKDLWPGAGWGIIDSENRPKAAYYYLKRAWQPQALLITDEGLDGLQLHALNESSQALEATIELEILQFGKTVVASNSQGVEIPARGSVTVIAAAMLSHFFDMTYAYRFGPPQHDLVVARLRCAETNVILGEDFYFPQGFNLPYQEAAHVQAGATMDEAGNVLLTLEADCFLQTVYITAKGYKVDNNYFHLSPHRTKQLRLVPQGEAPQKFKGYITALNLREEITVKADG